MKGLKPVSQKTITEIKRVLSGTPEDRTFNFWDSLYERDFPDWFLRRADQHFSWDWREILTELRNGSFFFVHDFGGGRTNIISARTYMTDADAEDFGEVLIQRLAAFATTLPETGSLLRSLQLDGFDVDTGNLVLVPLEGPVSAKEEEDRLTLLIKSSGVPNAPTVFQHVEDAHTLFTQGKNHASLGQSRNIVQALIDGISESTATNGEHSTNLPGATANRITYLKDVGFFNADEESAFKSGWGTLSAGTHPGVPEREQTRIGLVIALEFGQLLLLKFSNWKSNRYRRFS